MKKAGRREEHRLLRQITKSPPMNPSPLQSDTTEKESPHYKKPKNTMVRFVDKYTAA